jgi:hypothetical protein
MYPTLDDVRRNPDRLTDPRYRTRRVAFDRRTRQARLWEKFYNDTIADLRRDPTPSELETVKEVADRALALELARMRKSRGLPVDEEALIRLRGQQHRARMALGLLQREGSPPDSDRDVFGLEDVA